MTGFYCRTNQTLIPILTAPLYLSEISPQKVRGSLISMYQLMITIGIVLAFLSNTWLASYATFGGVTGGHWRTMLGVIAIPAPVMFLGVLLLPESPRWLFLKGFKDRAVAVFKRMRLNDAEIAAEVKEIEENLKIKQNGFEMFKTNPILIAIENPQVVERRRYVRQISLWFLLRKVAISL